MPEYKQVLSGLAISKKLVDFMQDIDPQKYPASNRGYNVVTCNDILQGRRKISVDTLMQTIHEQAGQQHPEKAAQLCAQIKDFVAQKQLLLCAYGKSSSKAYKYKFFDLDPDKPLKIINQRIYDSAVKNGFPPDFFRESYFDRVTFYCLPDNADFCFSRLDACNFIVCRIWGARIESASIYDTDFHTVDMRHTTFFHSTIAHTHFRDSCLSLVSLQQARLKTSNTIDCVMDRINYTSATLDGCSFDRVDANGIRNLDTATITMGGATNEECQRNKNSVYKALGVSPPQAEKKAPTIKRRDAPER